MTRAVCRYRDTSVVSGQDWEMIARAFGFSSAADMFAVFNKADERREARRWWPRERNDQ